MQEPEKKRGIRLIDVFIVVLILGALGALLLPLTSRTHINTHEMACKANLHQVGLALAMYSQSWDEIFPMTSSQGGNTGEALSLLYPDQISDAKIFHCRADRGPGRKPTIAPRTHLLSNSSYCYSAWGASTSCAASLEVAGDRDIMGIKNLSNHKLEGANVLFADGRVSWEKDRDPSDTSLDMTDGDDLTLEDDIGDFSDIKNTTDAFLGPASAPDSGH